jgi:putative DNA primase/helicase
MYYQKLPDELKKNALFCGWIFDPEKGKVPYDLKNGCLAKSNDQSTFSPWEIVERKIDNYIKLDKDGTWKGGLGLGIFNGFSAVDIDHCVTDGKPNAFAKEIIDYFNSYTELSPSHTGIRIIFTTKDALDEGKYYVKNSKLGLEMYVSGSTFKFVTLTGDSINPFDVPVKEISILNILDKYMSKKSSLPSLPVATGDGVDDLEPFINSDPKLNELWNNKAPGSGANESELDLALCDKLAFYFANDKEKVNDAFISSPYFTSKDDKHKDKWLNRDGYRNKTLDMACSQPQVYGSPKVVVKSSSSPSSVLLDYTDTGNAYAFVNINLGILKYNFDNSCWMIWNGKWWQADVTEQARNMVDDMVNEMKMDTDKLINDKEYLKNVKYLLSKSGKDNLLNEARHVPGIPSLNSNYDSDIYLFNCHDGVLDLRDLSIRKSTPEMMISKYSDINIDKTEPVLFNKFMAETFKGSESLIDYVETIFSLCLTGDVSEQKVWFFVGEGNNGKSVITDVMMSIFGDYAAKTDKDLILDKKFQSQNQSHLARLNGKRLVFITETGQNEKLNEPQVKDMSGGEPLIARFLYKNEFEFTPQFKMIMMSNYEPIIRGTDYGIWRRTRIVRFKNIIPPDKIDTHLSDKLIKERNSIFWLLVKHYVAYRKAGRLMEPQEVIKETEEYRTDMDLVQKWINENCEVDKSYYALANDLWQNFDMWLNKRKEYQMSQNQFGRNLSRKFEKRRAGHGIVYLGIKLV